MNLTPVDSPVLSSEFSVTTPQGGNWNPRRILRVAYDGYSDIKEVRFEFETLVCVDYVNYISRNQDTPLTEFTLKGSNDNKNWTNLLHKENEIIYGKIYTEKKGCFRYYDLIIDWTSDNNKPSGATLWETQIDNNASELKALTPLMSGNTTNYAAFTAGKIITNSATQITDGDFATFTVIGYDENQNRWA